MLSSVFDTCIPRDEIRSGDLSLDLFAAKLRPVVEGKAPQIYQQPAIFLSNTFPTDGLRTLITEVFGRLTGRYIGSPIIRLETSFGGGKTHDEIALWHMAKQGRRIDGLNRFVDDISLIPDRPIQVAAVDGRDLDPEAGVYHPETGITTYTLWGEIAYQIGGIEGYQLLRGADENRVSPGTSVIDRLVGQEPTLIILDEIARHLRAAKAKTVGQSTLAEQVVAFLFSLMDQAASCNNLVFVYSLASESDTFAKETAEIQQELMRASARQERVLSPSTDIEVYNIVRQRLFASISAEAAEKASEEYLQAFRASRVNLPDGCKDATYSRAIANSYPFHPELFNLLTKKIASIPEFQRTRGALRLFARVVRYLWQHPELRMPMIHPHHLPIGLEEEITSDLTSRLQRPLMRLPIAADIYNPTGREAHAQLQDQEWLSAGKPPFSTWVGRTIFLHSLTQGISSGIRRTELNLSLLTPGVDIGFVDRALERLSGVAWYLDVDPITSVARFKEEPSINKIIAEEKEQVGITEAKEELRTRRDTIFATRFFHLVAGPDGAHDVDDDPNTLALCIIDFNEATITSSTDGPPPLVEQIFNNTGESGKFRTFRNRLLFLLANEQELDRAIDITREFKAVRAILRSQNRMDDLSQSQQNQVKQKEGDLDLAVRVALTNAYRHLFYPSNDPVKASKGLMHYPLPAQDASTVKGNRNQQDVVLKALKDCGKVRSQDAASYAPAYVLQKVWPPGIDHWTTKALREQFAKDLGLNILLDAEVSKLRDTIRRGLQEGQWDIKVGDSRKDGKADRLFIKTEGSPLVPETIEFSERMELYRRGILKPPEPRVIELDAQVLAGGGNERTVQVRWRAKEALQISLYQDGELIQQKFLPSDSYECQITRTTQYRLVADYGSGETAEATTNAVVYTSNGGTTISGNENGENYGLGTLLDKPTQHDLDGSPNKVFNDLTDWMTDQQVQSITEMILTVADVVDYRKMGTTLPLLVRYQLEIEQFITIQTGQQFVRLEYQGDVRGFQSFFSTINGLLNQQNVQATLNLRIKVRFDPAIAPKSPELTALQQALARNPVERMSLHVQVEY
ncbi:MAG: ATP-binding protein [Synechococcales cyanobacterium K44_A2020_017]|nr:ATP-binding protein [Synechococcales cyanobacterium K32_A2020_035]MBF2095868.1 ATP-binding protein [Synechococcales cyanobacterium K44_A2020_017]